MSQAMMRSAVVCVIGLIQIAHAQERVFSGPQPGEKLSALKVRGVLGELAGKEFDPVANAKGGPLAIVFVHEATRPSIGLTRLLMDFAARRVPNGLTGGIVFLNQDATEAENFIKRASHALPTQVPIGVAVDGAEGPGSYGLNRKVALTILVAKDNVVRANFALVQPSIQADAERIAKQFVEVSGGGQAPTLAELGVTPDGKPGREMAGQQALEPLLRSLIRLTNDEKAVKEAAAAIEKLVASDEQAKSRLADITAKIVSAGKVGDYGTPAAQQVIRQWAVKYGSSVKQ